MTGVVLDFTGRARGNAEVLMATPSQSVRCDERGGNSENDISRTDAAGHFAFPDPGEAFAVLTRAGAGFAMAEFPAGQHDVGTLRLQPWASVRGQFRDGGKPAKGASILLDRFVLFASTNR